MADFASFFNTYWQPIAWVGAFLTFLAFARAIADAIYEIKRWLRFNK